MVIRFPSAMFQVTVRAASRYLVTSRTGSSDKDEWLVQATPLQHYYRNLAWTQGVGRI